MVVVVKVVMVVEKEEVMVFTKSVFLFVPIVVVCGVLNEILPEGSYQLFVDNYICGDFKANQLKIVNFLLDLSTISLLWVALLSNCRSVLLFVVDVRVSGSG